MTLLCLNDLTFLIIRLVCMIQFNVRSFNTYFFTAKNALILILDVNRIYSLNKELNLQAKRENSERQQQPSVLHLRRWWIFHISLLYQWFYPFFMWYRVSTIIAKYSLHYLYWYSSNSLLHIFLLVAAQSDIFIKIIESMKTL